MSYFGRGVRDRIYLCTSHTGNSLRSLLRLTVVLIMIEIYYTIVTSDVQQINHDNKDGLIITLLYIRESQWTNLTPS